MNSDRENEAKNRQFEKYALKHMNSLYKYALSKAKNESDAMDLVQETYLRAYKFFDTFTKGTNCRAWLFRIMRNTFINSIRKNSKMPIRIPISDIGDKDLRLLDAETPEDQVFDDLFDDNVDLAINSLKTKYRTVILLADVENLKYREIADTIGCPVGTVMSRLHRGRMMLRKKLRYHAHEYGYEEAKMASM